MGIQAAKCPACREPALRERFGCDKKATNAVWTGTCEFCIGSGCPECANTGERWRYRCPTSMTDDDGRRALEFACAIEIGFLPDNGSYGHQVHSGMNAINLARMEKAKIERARMDSQGSGDG